MVAVFLYWSSVPLTKLPAGPLPLLLQGWQLDPLLTPTFSVEETVGLKVYQLQLTPPEVGEQAGPVGGQLPPFHGSIFSGKTVCVGLVLGSKSVSRPVQ